MNQQPPGDEQGHHHKHTHCFSLQDSLTFLLTTPLFLVSKRGKMNQTRHAHDAQQSCWLYILVSDNPTSLKLDDLFQFNGTTKRMHMPLRIRHDSCAPWLYNKLFCGIGINSRWLVDVDLIIFNMELDVMPQSETSNAIGEDISTTVNWNWGVKFIHCTMWLKTLLHLESHLHCVPGHNTVVFS